MRQRHTVYGTPYHIDKQGNIINQYGQRDALLGFAIAGENHAEMCSEFYRKHPRALRIGERMFTQITSSNHNPRDDLFPDLKTLKKWKREYQKSIKQNPN